MERGITADQPNESAGQDEAGILLFQCNICGEHCRFPLEQLGRETASCPQCRSNPRKRAMVHVLARRLFDCDKTLAQFPVSRQVRGLGMTDPHLIALRLAEKFDYQNTFFDTEPALDIMAPLPAERVESYDFVSSSEVLEHVIPPVRRAFENIYRLLKPGGLFVLSTPYTPHKTTTEHFPELSEFRIVEQEGRHTLINTTREGVVQTFDHLIFHGGPGMTLEMRVFAESDLLAHLAAVGFSSIQVHSAPCFRYGIWWPAPFSFPISALKSPTLKT